MALVRSPAAAGSSDAVPTIVGVRSVRGEASQSPTSVLVVRGSVPIATVACVAASGVDPAVRPIERASESPGETTPPERGAATSCGSTAVAVGVGVAAAAAGVASVASPPAAKSTPIATVAERRRTSPLRPVRRRGTGWPGGADAGSGVGAVMSYRGTTADRADPAGILRSAPRSIPQAVRA